MRALVYVAIGALTFGVAGCKKETANSPTPGQKVGGAVDATTQKANEVKNDVVAGVAPSGSSNLNGIRSTLESVVDNALGKDDLKDAAAHFAGADEQRIKGAQLDQTQLNAEIKKFKDGWKTKYNDNFAVMDADKVFAADWATLTSSDASGAPAKTGTATLKAFADLSELKVPVVSENGKWRVDVPDDVDGPKLMANVLAAIQAINANTAGWPADKQTAERVVARRVLGAVVNAK
jgi:hypothetical protein